MYVSAIGAHCSEDQRGAAARLRLISEHAWHPQAFFIIFVWQRGAMQSRVCHTSATWTAACCGELCAGKRLGPSGMPMGTCSGPSPDPCCSFSSYFLLLPHSLDMFHQISVTNFPHRHVSVYANAMASFQELRQHAARCQQRGQQDLRDDSLRI